MSSGPLNGKVFSQNGTGRAQELAAIQNKQNEEVRLQLEKEAKEIHASAGRDLMPGMRDFRGGPAGSGLVVSISTTDPAIEIKDIRASTGRRTWASKQKEKIGDSSVFRNGPAWPCEAELTIEVNYFDQKKSERSQKKLPVKLECSS